MDGDTETRRTLPRTLPRTKAQASRTAKAAAFSLKVEFDREVDGRWIADIPALPGVTVYGRTRKQALTAVEVLALRVIADRIEHGEAVPL
ncbi:MAG TPA: type II toxin-antitoxin system HicB family antitoxin [Bryobacteraceae bacterium]|nr:type II toxin-antitoxin system HicB family antitoxin [Bryobacteraceae bacterium]